MDAVIAVIQTTLNDRKAAAALAHAMVEEHLAACVQIDPDITSVYRWQDACETATEIRLTIKTSLSSVTALCDWLRQAHPYELPEIVVQQLNSTGDYAAWVEAQTSARKHQAAGQTHGR